YISSVNEIDCVLYLSIFIFFFSCRRRHTSLSRDWSSDVCSSDLQSAGLGEPVLAEACRLVESDLTCPWTATELAAEVGVSSRTQIGRASSRKVGKIWVGCAIFIYTSIFRVLYVNI